MKSSELWRGTEATAIDTLCWKGPLTVRQVHREARSGPMSLTKGDLVSEGPRGVPGCRISLGRTPGLTM